jgi:SAM-dependent methyltransferase
MPVTHWERIYQTRPVDEVSWFQAKPATSLRLVEEASPGRGSSLVDVGGGASTLVDELVAEGFTDITVVDVSQRALDVVHERLGGDVAAVRLVHGDVLTWEPDRSFGLWHDRAVFHFLTDPRDRERYVTLANAHVEPGGTLILATFAADGPTHCSGLPVSRYDALGLAAEFRDDFDLVHSEREEHVTPAGVVQPFTWVVLRRRPRSDGG